VAFIKDYFPAGRWGRANPRPGVAGREETRGKTGRKGSVNGAVPCVLCPSPTVHSFSESLAARGTWLTKSE